MKSILWPVLLLLTGLLFRAGTAYGQAPYTNYSISDPRALRGQGACQLLDGNWRSGKLRLEPSGHLRVQFTEGEATVYQAGELKAFVLKTDTFGVVRNVSTPSRWLSAAFAQKLYQYGQLVAFKLDHRYTGASGPGFSDDIGAPTGAMDLVLQPATGDAVVVPAGRAAFIRTMLPLVGDCPELAAQITKGKVGRQHMQQILQTYARWQKSTSLPTSN